MTAEQFPCAQCGASLQFTPDQGQLSCPYCGHQTQLPKESADTIEELDYRGALAHEIDATQVEETTVQNCQKCGAATQFDPDQHATTCAFCATPIVGEPARHRHFRPRSLLPFTMDERGAKKALTTWLGNRWFTPGGFAKGVQHGGALKGVYLPWWTFDADTQSQYQGQRGDVYMELQWVTVEEDGRRKRVQRQVPRIRWRPVRGRVRRNFDDILIPASRTLPDNLLQDINQWDLNELQPYRPDYLAGFAAQAYQVDLQEGYKQARSVMDARIQRDIRFDIGGDQQRIERIATEVDHVTFKHTLFPVWVAAYRFRGKLYQAVIHGRSGRVSGQRPWSLLKLAFTTLLVLAVGAAGAMLANEYGLFDALLTHSTNYYR